jgi:hypothetical protein
MSPRDIVVQVARGRLSKQIAHDIGIAEATVKVHRARNAEDEGRPPSGARQNSGQAQALVAAMQLERAFALTFGPVADGF